MTIGQVAVQLEISVQAIRYYERVGLLSRIPRTQAGYRIFGEQTVRRIRFILHAQDVGFSLKEIGELLDLRAEPDGSCNTVKDYATKKIVDLKSRMDRLQAMATTLEHLVDLCSEGLSASDCPVLEALDRYSEE